MDIELCQNYKINSCSHYIHLNGNGVLRIDVFQMIGLKYTSCMFKSKAIYSILEGITSSLITITLYELNCSGNTFKCLESFPFASQSNVNKPTLENPSFL